MNGMRYYMLLLYRIMYTCAMVKSWSVYPVPFLGGDQSIHRDKNIEYPKYIPHILLGQA